MHKSDPDGKRIIVGDNTKDALTKLAQIAATKYGRGRLDQLIKPDGGFAIRET